MDVVGKNILITGANRGIGLALARKAAKYETTLHLLNRSRNESVEAELIELGAREVHFWDLFIVLLNTRVL